MTSNNDEGELVIQSSEISSSVPSTLYIRRFNCNFHDHRSIRLSHPPIPWQPNQASLSRYELNIIRIPAVNGPGSGVRVIKSPAQLNARGEGSTRKAIFIVAMIFILSLLALFYLYMMFPELEPEEMQYIKIPWDIEDAKKLGIVLNNYKEKYYIEVMMAVIITYIFLQTFAIPGSISLSILSGFLFNFFVAIVLVCFCSATGASLCYAVSYFLGRRIVYKYFPERVKAWALTVNKHREHLINYIIFLRMTPFLPNWFINISAPVIDVPLKQFWLGTFIGVAPPSVVAIQAGQALQTLTSTSDAVPLTTVILLVVFALLTLIPVLLKKKIKDAIE